VSSATVDHGGTAGVSPAFAEQEKRPGRPRSQTIHGEHGPTIGSAIAEAAAALAGAGFDEPRRRARRMSAAALGLSETEIFAHPERSLSGPEEERITAMLGRMLAREPLTRIVGRREFWGLELSLSADTLDPRPETETVVEAVLARRPDRSRAYRILDLGTGSGCLLLALLSEFPTATGVGIDLSPGAIATARCNAEVLSLGARARFVVGDWSRALAGHLDVVVANPPYIAAGTISKLPPEVREHDPHLALDGGTDGLAAYRAIAADLPRLLSAGGLFATEIGSDQQEPVSALLRDAGFIVEAVIPDLAGLPRCVVARR
jgi:release factor glutamine methyltransferase